MAERLLLVFFFTLFAGESSAFLTPQESETRETKRLDGVWNFRVAELHDQERGFREQWYKSPLDMTGEVIPMPVPSSYNDVTQNSSIRDHIGWAWYDTTFYCPQRWNKDYTKTFLHFGSAHYNTFVWLNGINVLYHSGGHLPFQAEVTKYLKFSGQNRLTVAINNTLTSVTVPQGSLTRQTDETRYPPGYMTQSYSFDFFNYAGIHRSVVLYTTPKIYIEDINVTTDVKDHATGMVTYSVTESLGNVPCTVELSDKKGNVVAKGVGLKGSMEVMNAHLWWPHTMNKTAGYLYTLKVVINSTASEDVYYLRIGIRKVSWNKTSLLINGKPLYFRGMGKHEDSNVRGKGLDNVLNVKDFNLLKWLGANSFRTSHYPYSEEIMDLADEMGIVVIDECPAVSLDGFSDEMLKHHLNVMRELISRDKNRPSVIMWSVGNEPVSGKDAAGPYFKSVTDLTRQLDPTRPVTLILAVSYQSDKTAQYLDVIGVNRYYGWYSDSGHLEVIKRQVETEYEQWHIKFKKPVFISEYGADTVAGLHTDPPFVFSEDYQTALMLEYFSAFDSLRKNSYFVGEMIWNFADFMTAQGYTRVVGNKKGILTRERQPKASARLLRARYWKLAQSIERFQDLPSDLTNAQCPVSHF